MKQNKSVLIIFLSLILSCLFLSGEVFAYKQSDLEKLKSTKSCPKCDLSSANLRNADLGGADLRNADLGGADLSSANLSGAKLNSDEVRGAEGFKIYTNLSNANLRNANLRNADLRNADLRVALLGGADLRGADLRGADLRGADLRGVDLSGANVTGCKFISKEEDRKIKAWKQKYEMAKTGTGRCQGCQKDLCGNKCGLRLGTKNGKCLRPEGGMGRC